MPKEYQRNTARLRILSVFLRAEISRDRPRNTACASSKDASIPKRRHTLVISTQRACGRRRFVRVSASLRFSCFFVRIRGCFWARGSILKFVENAFLAGGRNIFFRFDRLGSGQSCGGSRPLPSALLTRKGSKRRKMQQRAALF